jgi:FkbH-like protein
LKLVEALEILKQPRPDDASRLRVSLVCGFTPLHLETFLAAELRKGLPLHEIEISTGVFDDLIGNLQRSTRSKPDAVCAVIEWADIDPRLGLRRLGGWRLSDVADAVVAAEAYVAHLEQEMSKSAESVPVIACLPTLPLPPLFLQRPEESGAHELQLRLTLASFAAMLARRPGIRLLSAQTLDHLSPASERRDLRSEIVIGFPYSLDHASALGALLASVIQNPAPKRGLITDLDDTLWAGIVGEVGVENVAWSLDTHSQAHGLYQQMLASLASEGVLIGVASKNDPSLVDQVFERKDLLLSREAVFPIEAHWDPKSTSVERILDHWNIAPDMVVFVDDSPMELAEIKAAFPDVECVLFPREDYYQLSSLLSRLRELFGKNTTTTEDSLRLASIRSASEFRISAKAANYSPDEFLENAEGTVVFLCGRDRDPRAFELLNKTNQFNLNGRRMSEVAFNEMLDDPAAFLVTATYEDRYGPLGKIAALLGRKTGKTISVDAWVMSCRAFSRRIEHHCLSFLFERFGVDEIKLSFEPTDRNGPLQEFLGTLVRPLTGSSVGVSKDAFFAQAPRLVHRVSEAEDG